MQHFEPPTTQRRWLAPITAVFCTVLVISNVSAIKPLSLPGLPFMAARFDLIHEPASEAAALIWKA